jgi:predicted regulator of Ras-like GTPase activity (Roadblock/LC7/MglB family)
MEPTALILALSAVLGTLIGGGGILWAQRRVITGKLIPVDVHESRMKQWEDQVIAVRAELVRQAEIHMATLRHQAEQHAATIAATLESSERRNAEVRELATLRVADRDAQLTVVRADRDARLAEVAADNATLWDALRTTERAYETVTRAEIARSTAAVRVTTDVLRQHGFADQVRQLGPGDTTGDDDDTTTG